MSYYFKTDAHRARFATLVQEHGKVDRGRIDAEYGAALYILTSSSEIREKSENYISRNRIDFDEMLANEDWSDGLSVLVRLAANLFNGNIAIGPREFRRLDEANFQVALTALMLTYTAPPLANVLQQ